MSSTREQVLDFMTRTAEAIAQTFGNSCETLIHDMSKPGHPIVAIFNSHISGRQPGSTADIFGDDLGIPGETDWHFKLTKDAVNSLAVTNLGHYVKSTTINFIGEDYHYALGINFDYTALNNAMSILQDLTRVSADLNDFIDSTNYSQLETIFEDCLQTIGKPIADMKKSDKLQLVALLMKQNAFSFQKAILYVADRLNVSRYTMYKYCSEVKKNINLQ